MNRSIFGCDPPWQRAELRVLPRSSDGRTFERDESRVFRNLRRVDSTRCQAQRQSVVRRRHVGTMNWSSKTFPMRAWCSGRWWLSTFTLPIPTCGARTLPWSEGAASLPEVPGYVIERQIGRGGSAVVYLARERKHDRAVAVKVLHPALAVSLQATRFLREIEITARLAHPNILPLLDSGRAGELLYYVTPFVAGESLRARLDRERRLAVGDALRLTTEVAEALDYAHRQGVIHRDVKPENILLADGHALVADFGIARAVSAASDDRLTTGLVPCTPRYMSPEQADDTAGIDGRSDIYSLACVLYELLVGDAPFLGDTPQQVIAKHLSAPVPSMRHVSPRVPKRVEGALVIALAKSREDRFQTAAAFANALVEGSNGWSDAMAAHRRRGSRVIMVVTAAVLAALAFGTTDVGTGGLHRASVALGFGEPVLDTMLYVVVPLDSLSREPAEVGLAELLRTGLGRWQDIVVEDEARVNDAVTRLRSSPGDRGKRVARMLGAGRYVRLAVTRAGDSIDLSAGLFDTQTNRRLKATGLRLSKASAPEARAMMAALADSLLLRDGLVGPHAAGSAGTMSLFARQAYIRGHQALEVGDFARADSQFFSAVRRDPDFAQALVWLANVRLWENGGNVALWGQLTNQAAARRHNLAANDSVLLDALTAVASGDVGRACELWRQLTTTEPNDYAAWYSLAACLRRDRIVIRSVRSPAHWQFRSSTHESVKAYERAFRLKPSVLNAFGGRRLADLQVMLYTSGARMRQGRTLPPDTARFTAYPTWDADSLAFTPLLEANARLAPLSDGVDEAVQRQRMRFRDVARMWRAEFPTSVYAMEAMALAMEMLGDASALDTLHHARVAATDVTDRLRMAVSEVWLRTKFSLPADVAGLRTARALADSIVWSDPNAIGDETIGSLAALTGRAALAASYARSSVGDASLPALAQIGPSLIAFAALGGPADTLGLLERTVDAAIRSLPISQRGGARRDWLSRAATLSFPEYQFASLSTGETGLPLGDLVAASVRQDTPRVRRMLSNIALARRSVRPADIMPDGLLPEAAALARLGDVSGAVARLDPTLRAIRFTSSQDLALSSQAGSLIRALVLRADLAHQAGDDETARLWARAVVELWARADPFLQPTVQRMQQLAR